MTKNKVQRQSLTKQIQDILIERIIAGTLQPGDRLKELQIAKEFGTSQAPVREALRSLQATGYVEHKAHVGALVKTYTKKETEEAYQIRESLEAHSLITADIAPEKFAENLRTHLQTMEIAVSSANLRQFTEADNDFHRTIIECTGNSRMLEIWDSLHIQLQVIATLIETKMPIEIIYALHPPIVSALARGHREGAARFLASHYREIGSYWHKAQ